MSEGYRLYGTSFSLYTGKVRSYLHKKGIPFEEVHSTASVYKKFIIPRTGVRYVPVLQTPDDQVLQDTTVILDELEKRFPETSIYPRSPKQKLVSLLLETYGDEWLVIPAMHYRWDYQEVNQPFIYREFGTVVSPKLPSIVRGWLGAKLGSKFKGFVPMLGITEQTKPAIEESYYSLLADLNTHFEDHDYLLGGRPTVADFSFIGPFYAHLYRDPYPGQKMRENAPAVAAWVERMIEDKEAMQGELEDDDQIPPTLLPVLQRMANEQIPVLIDTDDRLKKWRRSNPNKPIPRTIGNHEFTVQGVTGSRMVAPYALWMFKRPIDFYRALPLDIQSEVDDLLKPLGFGDTLELGLANRLIRPNNQLQFAS